MTLRKSISRRHFTAGLAAATGLAATGLPVRRARAATPLKIGALAPLSGRLATEGAGCKRGFDLAPALLKDMGMPIEITFVDTESNPDKARTAAEQLIGSGAQMLIGTFDSGETTAVAQVAEQRGIPHVINIAAAPKITEQGFKFVFRNFATGPMLVMNGFSLMKETFAATGFTPKTAVFLHANDTFGQAMKAGVEALFPKMELPFQIVETIAYDPKAKDLSVEVTKAKAANPDLLMPVCHGADAILLIKEMVKQRWEPKMVATPGSPGTYDKSFYESLGKFSEFVIANVPWLNPKSKMTQTLAAAFAKAFPNDLLELNVGFTFEACLIAADAHKRAGSANPQALVEALKATNIADHVMVGGPIKFDEKGQNMNIKSAVLQNIKRKPTVVLPADASEAKPVVPMPGWNDKARG